MPLVYTGQEDALDRRLKFFDHDPMVWGQFSRADFYRTLLTLKHEHPALSNDLAPGNLEVVDVGNPQVFAFRRIAAPDELSIAVNLSQTPQTYSWSGKARAELPAWGWAITSGH
jgi:hypothetical protein